MTKKSIPDLYSIAKDTLALVEYIKNNKLMLQDSSSKRLKEISEYIEKIKETADIQNIWENASAGATSSGSFAAVVGGGASKPIKRMDEYTNEPKMTPVDEKGRPLKKTNDAKLSKVEIKEDWKSAAKKAGIGLGVAGTIGAAVVGGNMDDSNSIMINGTKYEHVDDIGGNIPFNQTKVVQLDNGKYALLWKEGGSNLKQTPGSNQMQYTWCDKRGGPLPYNQNSNDYSIKGNKMPSYTIKYVVKEDVGNIAPVSPGEETALNNLRSVTKGKYTGTQVGNVINKAAGGGTLNAYDQKIIDPIVQNLDTILQDPNSANQLKSAAQRATGVATAKAAATAQQQKQQQQKNGQAQPNNQNPNQPTTPVNATPLGGTNMGTTGAMQSSNQLPTSGPNNQGMTKPSSNNTGNNTYGTVGTNGSNSMTGATGGNVSAGTTGNQQTNNQQTQVNNGSGQKPQTGFNTSESQIRSEMKQDITEWNLLKSYLKFKGNK